MSDAAPTPPSPPNRKKMWILIGSGAGALVLLFGCCCLGVGGWFFFLRSRPPEKTLVGKWEVDIEATNKIDPKGARGIEGLVFEFQEFGGMVTTIKDKPGAMDLGNWKVVESKGDTVSIDTHDSRGKADRVSIKVLDRNHIRIISDNKREPDIVMKRM